MEMVSMHDCQSFAGIRVDFDAWLARREIGRLELTQFGAVRRQSDCLSTFTYTSEIPVYNPSIRHFPVKLLPFAA